MQYARCVECGISGHLKCTSVRKSNAILLNFRVEENLDAFMKPKKNSKKAKRLSNSNILIPTSGSEEGENSDVAIHFDHMIGCAGCGMPSHDVSDCRDRSRGN